MSKTLSFDVLLNQAFQEWPTVIVLQLTRRNVGTKNERYSIDGLGALESKLSEKYINSTDEVLMRNLHWAIFQTIHALAPFCKQIETRNIRNEEIKKRFERLLTSAKNDDLDWLPKDKSLIEDYFESMEACNGVEPS